MSNQEQKPKVGVGVMIFKDGQVLLGKRKGSHGSGEYSFPGGHLEYLESYADCARRETQEEAGIEIKNLQFQYLANVTAYAPKHYVHIGMTAEWASGEPVVMEPEKCENWDWYDLDDLPEPVFHMCQMAFDAHESGKIFSDVDDSLYINN